MPSPKVSIVIPFFNAESTIERAIQSILQQTFRDFELILVDNNSTDRSLDIAQQFSLDDHRVILSDEKRQGVGFAANKGNALALGKYIARMDSDDFAHAGKIEKQVTFLDANPQIGVVSCLVKHVGHHENTKGLARFVDWCNTLQTHHQIMLNRFVEAPIINPTALFRRELLEQFGGYVHHDFPEDYEMWLRWLDSGVKMAKLPEVLFDWYDSNTRLTRTDERYRVDVFFKIKSKYLVSWLKREKIAIPIYIWGAGRVTRKRVEHLSTLGIQVAGFIDIKTRRIASNTCIHYMDFNWNLKTFIISYVTNWDARSKIKNFLLEKGKIEGNDFILVG